MCMFRYRGDKLVITRVSCHAILLYAEQFTRLCHNYDYKIIIIIIITVIIIITYNIHRKMAEC